MSSEEKQDREMNDLKAFEAQLAMLQPAAPRLDRDRLLFALGQASAPQTTAARRTHRWFLPVAAGALAGMAATLLGMLAVRPERFAAPQVVERVVYLPAPIAEHKPARPTPVQESLEKTAPDHPAAANDFLGLRLNTPYTRLRSEVLAWGVEREPPSNSVQPLNDSATKPWAKGATPSPEPSYGRLREGLL